MLKQLHTGDFSMDEATLLKHVTDAVESLDGDGLAKLAGDLLGGKCFAIASRTTPDLEYIFAADENYAGAFDGQTDE